MLFAIVFAHVWGVLQLIVLGSLTRTARTRTVFMAMAAGFFACAPIAVLLQATWVQSAASLTGTSAYEMSHTASYTLDPFMEEMLKLAPVGLLLLIPSIRRQWSVTDCVLAGAAVGSGFGLAELLYVVGASPQAASPIDGGWILAVNVSLPVVPSVWTSMTAWLPAGMSDGDPFMASQATSINLHLAWSAIGGLALGLILRLRRRFTWLLGAALFLYIGLDHASVNAESHHVAEVFVASFHALRHTLRWLPILALAVAWLLDRQRWTRDGNRLEPMLSVEMAARPRDLGTLRAAVSRLPVSWLFVSHFVRARRAHATARRVIGVLCRPAVIVWLVLMLLPFLWFIVGGSPQTAGVQRWMRGPIAWPVVVLVSTMTHAWLVWRLIAVWRLWRRVVALPLSDPVAIASLQILCGIGALGLGGYALTRAFVGLMPWMGMLSVHALDAFRQAQVEALLMAADAGTLPLGQELEHQSRAATADPFSFDLAVGGSQSVDEFLRSTRLRGLRRGRPGRRASHATLWCGGLVVEERAAAVRNLK